MTKDMNKLSREVESYTKSAYKVFFTNVPNVEGIWRGTIEEYRRHFSDMRYVLVKEILCSTREEMIAETVKALQEIEESKL